MHFLSVSPSSQKSVSRTRTVRFATLTRASRPYLSKIRDNGSMFIVDYRPALLKNSILLNLTVTQSGRYYYLSLSLFFFFFQQWGRKLRMLKSLFRVINTKLGRGRTKVWRHDCRHECINQAEIKASVFHGKEAALSITSGESEEPLCVQGMRTSLFTNKFRLALSTVYARYRWILHNWISCSNIFWKWGGGSQINLLF